MVTPMMWAMMSLTKDCPKDAASVRRYLINQGIEEERMTSQGYGETRPIADNKQLKVAHSAAV